MDKDEALDLALEALEETLKTLDDANAIPGGPIADTIWYSPYETLFDYLEVQIAAIKQARSAKQERHFCERCGKRLGDYIHTCTPPAAPMQGSTCNETLRAQGKAYPRTCRKCGLGPCIGLANAALDKKAENARELGLEALEYFKGLALSIGEIERAEEAITAIKQARSAPVQECLAHGECFGGECIYTTPPAAQRQWVGLTDVEIERSYETAGHYQTLRPQDRFAVFALARAIEVKLKEKNG